MAYTNTWSFLLRIGLFYWRKKDLIYTSLTQISESLKWFRQVGCQVMSTQTYLFQVIKLKCIKIDYIFVK